MIKSFWLGLSGSLLLCNCASAAEEPGTPGDASASGASATAQPLQPALQIKGLYATGAVGANWPTTVSATETSDINGDNYGFDEFHTGGVSAEAGIGYDFGAIRAEATYAYDKSRTTGYSDPFGTFTYSRKADVSKNSVFASVYWDIDLKSRFSPYLGAGIGYSRIAMSRSADAFGSYDGYAAGAFAYQAKLGLNYMLNKRSEVFAEGVYRGMNSYESQDGDVTYWHGNYNSWGFQVGARLRFGPG